MQAFAASLATCTCPDSGNMSGDSRDPMITASFTFLAAANAAPLASTPDIASSICVNSGTEAEYSENVIRGFLPCVRPLPRGAGAARSA